MTNSSAQKQYPGIYRNRELAWLDFNFRVLEEAHDESNPLLERLRFLGITASNLDEFFMVRVAGLRRQISAVVTTPDPAGLTPREQLDNIRTVVERMLAQQHRILFQEIMPALRREGIVVRRVDELSRDQREELRTYFEQEVFPALTPLGSDLEHARSPKIRSGCLGVVLEFVNRKTRKIHRGLVEVPSALEYFIPVGKSTPRGKRREFITLDDLIRKHLPFLFTGCDISSSAVFRILRDMDLDVDDEDVTDLLENLRDQLRSRPARSVVRLDAPHDAPDHLIRWLQKIFQVEDDEVYKVSGPPDLARFASLLDNLRRPDLEFPPSTPSPPPPFQHDEPVADTIRRHGNIALFHPFQSFDPVVRFIEEAAEDPDVLAIKQTLYRVSGDSPVVRALQQAAENGKQVAVIVEVKARMDEERNLRWAEQLEQAGAHVVYGIAGLKVHCKALVVVRREAGRIVRYVHLSTGNYNDRTARLYTDIGMFTDNPDICFDVAVLFNVMTGSSVVESWRAVHTAPFDLRDALCSLIRREREFAEKGRPARITAKMNALVDPDMVLELYHAAQAGVQVDLIVRGPCCIQPPALPERMRVVSIVGRFLEHSRIYRFENGGQPDYFLSSADLMPRNLDRRIELLFPVYDPGVRKTLDRLLDWQLSDTWKGRVLTKRGYERPAVRDPRTDSQEKACRYFADLWRKFEESRRPGRHGERLSVLRKPQGPQIRSGSRARRP